MLVLGEIMIQGQIDPRSVNAIKRNKKFYSSDDAIKSNNKFYW